MKYRAVLAIALCVLFGAVSSKSFGQTPPGNGAKTDTSVSKPAGAPATSTATTSTTTSSSAEKGLPIVITVPDPGPWSIRPIPSPDAKQQAHLPLGPFSDKKFTVTIDPTPLGRIPRLAVDNILTGNTAYATLPATGSLELHRTDFDRVHRMEVTVNYEGKPVQNARVILTPEGGSAPTEHTIDAFAKGITVFEDVQVGKAKLSVVYGDNLTQSQDVVVSTDHTGDKLVVTAPVSTKVPTVEPTAQPASIAGVPNSTPAAGAGAAGAAVSPGQIVPTQTPASTGGGFVGFLGELLAFAIVCTGIYFFYRWAQSGGLAATLKKAGIETSGPAAAPAANVPWQPNTPQAPVVTDPSLCQFCGQTKDVGGSCACTFGGGASSGSSINGSPAATVPLSQPKLVGTMGVYSGNVFPLNLNGSAMTFGRETTNSVPLANDTTVSRRHASIRSEGAGFVVQDEGSSNGVFVNGVKIGTSQELRPGDEVQIGNTRFRFEL